MDGLGSKSERTTGLVVVGVGNEAGGRLDRVGDGDGADDLWKLESADSMFPSSV